MIVRSADIFEAGIRLIGAIIVLINLAHFADVMAASASFRLTYVPLVAPVIAIIIGLVLLFAGAAVTRIVYRNKD
jgi:uncharacterized membrane protein